MYSCSREFSGFPLYVLCRENFYMILLLLLKKGESAGLAQNSFSIIFVSNEAEIGRCSPWRGSVLLIYREKVTHTVCGSLYTSYNCLLNLFYIPVSLRGHKKGHSFWCLKISSWLCLLSVMVWDTGKTGFTFHLGLSFFAVRKCDKTVIKENACVILDAACNCRCRRIESGTFGHDWNWGLYFIQACKGWQSETPARSGKDCPPILEIPGFPDLCSGETQGVIITPCNAPRTLILPTLLAVLAHRIQREKTDLWKLSLKLASANLSECLFWAKYGKVEKPRPSSFSGRA